eukprot:5382068-Amphidinium_carterae.1
MRAPSTLLLSGWGGFVASATCAQVLGTLRASWMGGITQEPLLALAKKTEQQMRAEKSKQQTSVGECSAMEPKPVAGTDSVTVFYVSSTS